MKGKGYESSESLERNKDSLYIRPYKTRDGRREMPLRAHLDEGCPKPRVFKPPKGFLHCTCHPCPLEDGILQWEKLPATIWKTWENKSWTIKNIQNNQKNTQNSEMMFSQAET